MKQKFIKQFKSYSLWGKKMEKIEVLAENNTQSALNTLIEKTLDGEEKMEEDLGFLFDNNASQKKKKKNT